MSSEKQRTIGKPVFYEGVGLHAGLPVHMTLRPADVDEGICFVRTDLPGNPSVPANQSYVTNTMRATTLEKGEAKVFTVEHVLSALRGLKIDNCVVEMDSPEPPVGDGSSAVFVDMIKEAGVVEQDAPRKVYTVTKQRLVQEDDKFIAVLPYDGFRITFTSINPHPLLGVQFFDSEVTEQAYIDDISYARTIAFTEELEMMRKLGLGKGGTIENVVVYDTDTCLSQLRSDDELVRHKVLDIIGDLSLIGRPLKGHVIAVKSSHKLNNLLAKCIYEDM